MPPTSTPPAASAPGNTPTTPPLVAWLGYGGLLPFVALAVASVVDPARQGTWIGALNGYGAVILSFVGALHWGFAMALQELPDSRRNALFGWSVVPALLAWPALLLPAPWNTALLVLGFVGHYAQDVRLAQYTRLPAWFLPLRLRLTATACACLALGVAAQHG